MITYNHGPYIAQAINSVLDQQCDYEMQFIVSNDASTENTDAVIRNILQQDERAKCITYIHHEKNVGMMPNFFSALKQCTGDYIAVLDGDDFWIAPDKLQIQASYLDQHPECALVFTDFNQLVHKAEDQTEFEQHNLLQDKNIPDKSGWQDILTGNYIATCTCMIRNWLDGATLNDSFLSLSMGDWPLWILTGKKGYYKYLPTATATYRVHQTGNYSGIGTLKSMQHQIETLTELYNSSFFDDEEKRILNQKIGIQKRKRWRYKLVWMLKRIIRPSQA